MNKADQQKVLVGALELVPILQSKYLEDNNQLEIGREVLKQKAESSSQENAAAEYIYGWKEESSLAANCGLALIQWKVGKIDLVENS